MKKEKRKLERLSVDIDPTEHVQIKTFAAINGKSIREFVLESVRERLRKELEARDLDAMTTGPTDAMWAVWEKSAEYDKD